MKKLYLLLLYILLQFNLLSAYAGTAGITGVWEFTGQMSMYDPVIGHVGSSGFSGLLDFDGEGAPIIMNDLFFGESWSMHHINVTDNGDGTYDGNMLLDWDSQQNIPVQILWDISMIIDEYDMGVLSVTTLDGNGDGLPGLPMESGVFAGVSLAMDMNPVPVPTAIWLFSSGLVALAGIARRRNIRKS